MIISANWFTLRNWSGGRSILWFALALGVGSWVAISSVDFESILSVLFCGVAAILLVTILSRSLPAGIGVVISAGLLMPAAVAYRIPFGLNAAFVLAPMAIGLWLVSQILHRGAPLPFKAGAVRPVALLVGCSFLSFLTGQYPWFHVSAAPVRAQLGGLAIFLFSCGLFALAATELQDGKWLRRITWLFMVIAGLRVLLVVAPPLPAEVLALMPAGNLGSLFWTWLVAFACSNALMNRQLHILSRLALGALVAVSFFVTFIQWRDWVSGWLPPFVAVVVILVFWRPRLAVLGSAGLLMIGAANIESITGMIWTGDQQYSWLTRVEAWKVLSELIETSPIFGFGPANYYHYTPLYPILGWYVHFSSHNTYVDLLLQTGLLGLLCFLWFAVAVARIGLHLRHRTTESFSVSYVYASLGGLAGTLCAAVLGDWVLPFPYNVGIDGFPSSLLAWVFLGGLVALDQVSRRSASGGESSLEKV